MEARNPSPRFARVLSNVNLAVWVGVPGLIVVLMGSSGFTGHLGGILFLGIIFAFLGGLGIVGGLLGHRYASAARVAVVRGDVEGARRHVRAAVRVNLILGGLQLVLFGLGFLALTGLHH